MVALSLLGVGLKVSAWVATAVEVFVRTSAGSNATTRAAAWTPP